METGGEVKQRYSVEFADRHGRRLVTGDGDRSRGCAQGEIKEIDVLPYSGG